MKNSNTNEKVQK